MAAKSGPAIFVAKESFHLKGQLVPAGSTVVDGHPMLKGRAHLFRPFVPTFGTLAVDEPEKPAVSAAAGLEARRELVERAKALGLPASGKSADIEAAIAAEAKS
jgi:hypothetical protein